MTPKEIADLLRAELAEHMEAINKIMDMVEAMDKPPVAPDMPAVPYRSQWDADAAYIRSDCGPATVAMLLDFRGKHVAIDDISKACGLGPSKSYSTAVNLTVAAEKFGLALTPVSGWALEQFAARCPCIVLIHYGTITDRLDQKFDDGHWVVLLGVHDNQAIYHDPDWWPPRRNEGAARRIDTVHFAFAMHECARDGNPLGMGLVMAH